MHHWADCSSDLCPPPPQKKKQENTHARTHPTPPLGLLQWPALVALHDRVMALPRIQEYVKGPLHPPVMHPLTAAPKAQGQGQAEPEART